MQINSKRVEHYFEPIIGEKPWRARVGVGSFLTFDFGDRIPKANHRFGEWHLWIYQCEWVLSSSGQRIVDSESTRRDIERSVRALEKYALTTVRFDAKTFATKFVFGKAIELVCTRETEPSDLEYDELWMLYMPRNQVLSVTPTQVLLEPANRQDAVQAD